MSDYDDDDDFTPNLNINTKKSESELQSELQSDSESDSESESESDSDSESESESECKQNFKKLLEQQFPKKMYNEQELYRYRTINYLIWKKGNDIICDINLHFDATYSHNKICIKLLLEIFNDENKFSAALQEYVLNKKDKQYIKIDDVIKFFIDEVHNEKSKYCCNKKNNTTGMYCIYMPIIYYILGIEIDYNNDYRPNIDKINKQLWNKIKPKRSEWDILNAIQNYLMYHDLFSKYPDDLHIHYQYDLYGKKYDLVIGNYIGIEYNEKSNEHNNNSNDTNKELILHVSGFASMQFYEVKLDENLAYIKIFFSNLEKKLSEQLINNNYNFEQEYNFKQFYKFCHEEVEILNNSIKDIGNSDYKDKKKMINGKIKALEKWNLFLENTKFNIIFKKLYDYNINGNVAKKANPQNKYAQYNIPLKFVINILFRGNGKNIKKISWEYLELIDTKLYFSWYSLAELINSINDKSLYELKTMNFKLLMKIQELVENTCDIKLKNKNNIIEKFKYDFKEIINDNQTNYNSKLETQKKIHENTVSKLNGENKAYNYIINNIDNIKDFVTKTCNIANYCYKYTIENINNFKQTIKLMKKNKDEFNNNYDKCLIESKELNCIINYYLNNNIIKIIIDELINGKIQNITHKNMCNILTKLNSYLRNIKTSLLDTIVSNANFKEMNKLFVNINIKEIKQIDFNNYQLNLNQIGKPIILYSSNSLVFPIILTNDISDSISLTKLEGIFKVYNIPLNLLNTFYEVKVKRDIKNKNGTMVPYIKINDKNKTLIY